MKKYIVFALIALFAAVLFIACDNNVKVDNSVAFTQRIASEGAFVVNGKSYDSLQAAINAATGAKMSAPDPVKITLTKDYAGRAVSIPEDAQVAIDLNGHTLTFVDIKDTAALTVGEDAYFVMSNGTVTILDKTADLTLIDADDAHVVFSDVYADLSDDQNAVFITGSADGKAVFAASADSIVFGAVTAIGEHAAGDLIEYSDVALIVLNALSDVRMTNTYIDVSSTGHVTLNALAGENRFRATKGSSSITNNTDEPIVVFGGLYSIKRTSSMSYYGSLQEALDSLDKDGLVIVLRDNDDSTNPVVASNGKSFTIELYGNYYGPGYGIHATSITADADMEIVNSGYSNSVIYSEIYGDIDVAGKFVVTGNYGRIHIDGTVTSDGVDASNTQFNKDINSSGAVEAEDCLFYEAPSITADGNISINRSYGVIGDVVASGAIYLSTPEVNAVEYQLTVDAVNASSNNVSITGHIEDYVIVNGAVTAGEVTASYAVFSDTVTASKVTADYAVFGDDINSSGAVEAEDCLFYEAPSITADGNISINRSYGVIGDVVASGAIYLSTPEVNAVEYQLTVDAVNASSNNVSITGHIEDYVIVNGNVSCATLYADYARFNSSQVEASELTGGHYYGNTTLVGNRDSVVSSGYFNGPFAYDGTGTLTVTGGSFNETSYFNSGSVTLDGSAFFNDIDALTADVVIKSATIIEYEFSDVVELVHRIDQDSATQSVTIEYLPDEIEFLTSGVFDMTSVNIEGSASLYFAMYAPSTIIGGLIVGSPDSLAASVSFNFDNGYGKKQLAVSGTIGLLVEDGSGQSGDHNVILSTQQHGGLVTKCTYSGTTSYTYTLATGPGSTASPKPIPYPGYYEYSF